MNHHEAKFDTNRSDRTQGPLVHSPIFYISHPFILKIPGKPWGKRTHTHTHHKKHRRHQKNTRRWSSFGWQSTSRPSRDGVDLPGWWVDGWRFLRVGNVGVMEEFCWASHWLQRETIEVEDSGWTFLQRKSFCQLHLFLAIDLDCLSKKTLQRTFYSFKKKTWTTYKS